MTVSVLRYSPIIMNLNMYTTKLVDLNSRYTRGVPTKGNMVRTKIAITSLQLTSFLLPVQKLPELTTPFCNTSRLRVTKGENISNRKGTTNKSKRFKLVTPNSATTVIVHVKSKTYNTYPARFTLEA